MLRPHFSAVCMCHPLWPHPGRQISYVCSRIPWNTSDMKHVSLGVWHFSDLRTLPSCPCATSRIISCHPPLPSPPSHPICHAHTHDIQLHQHSSSVFWQALQEDVSAAFKFNLDKTAVPHVKSALSPAFLLWNYIVSFSNVRALPNAACTGRKQSVYLNDVSMRAASNIQVLTARPIFFSRVTIKYFAILISRNGDLVPLRIGLQCRQSWQRRRFRYCRVETIWFIQNS